MGTSTENTLTDFDLDLLLSSASSSLSETTDHGFQTQNVGMVGSSNAYQLQNMGIIESTDHSYQVQNDKSTGITDNCYQTQNIGANQHYQNQTGNISITELGYQALHTGNNLSYSSQGDELVKNPNTETLESHFKKLSTDFTSLQKAYDSKNNDYDAVKKQYAKLASDYAKLHKENKDHAMACITASSKCEILETKEIDYLDKIQKLTKMCEKYHVDSAAQNVHFAQYQSQVEDMQMRINDLNHNVQNEKNIARDSRKMISTLTNNNETLKEHLCLFACVIEGRKQIDKETLRFIKKYCKESTIPENRKKNIEIENFESTSVDTGRGSSLAYSPAYSMTFSPFSAGNVTPRNEQTKMTRDACTSPLPRPKMLDISTSPIIFDDTCSVISPQASRITVATNTMIRLEDKSTMAKARTKNTAISPIALVDTSLKAKIKTKNIATSPIGFGDISPVAKTKLRNIGTSPISQILPVDNTRTVNKIQTFNSATSPIRFHEPSPVAKIVTVNIATSPIRFHEQSPVAKIVTVNIATNPIRFHQPSPVAKEHTLKIAARPIKFDTPLDNSKHTAITNKPAEISSTKKPLARNMLAVASPVGCPNTPITPELKTKTLHIESNRTTEGLESSLPVSKEPKTSTYHLSKIREKLKEIVSKQSESHDDAENDLEIKMILNKHKLDWDLLSPISLSPEQNQESELAQSSKDLAKEQQSKETEQEYYSLAQSLHLSDSESIDSEINRDDFHIITNTPQAVSNKIFDLNKSNSDNIDNINESQNEMSIKNHTKTNRTHGKRYKKLTNLQKIYKANLQKNIKPYSIAFIKESVPSHNTESEKILAEKSDKKMLNKKAAVIEVSSKETKSSYKEPQALPKYDANRSLTEAHSKSTCVLSQFQTSPSLASVTKNKVCMIAEKQPKSASNVPCSQTNLPFRFDMKKTISSGLLQSQSKLLPESNTNKTECISKRTQSNSGSYIHPQPNIPSETDATKLNTLLGAHRNPLPKSSSSRCVETPAQVKPLPESDAKKKITNSTSEVPHTQTKSLPTFESKKKVCMTKVTQSDDISVIPHIRTHPLPVSCPKNAEKQSNKTNDISDAPTSTLLENDAQKMISESTLNNQLKFPDIQENKLTDCSSGIPTEVITEDGVGFSYAKPTNKRISRVRKGISTNPPVSSSHKESSGNSSTSNTSDTKLKRAAGDVINDELDAKRKRVPSTSQVDANTIIIDKSEIINESVSDDDTDQSRNKHSTVLNISPAGAPRSLEASNTPESLEKFPNSLKRPCNDYTELDMFTDQISSEPKQPKVIHKSISEKTVHSRDEQSIILSLCRADASSSSVYNNTPIPLAKNSKYQIKPYQVPKDTSMFTAHRAICPKKHDSPESKIDSCSSSLLKKMFYKYGSKTSYIKRPPHDNKAPAMAMQIEIGINICAKCISNPNEYAKATERLASALVVHDQQHIVNGLMKYLNNPARKADFINTTKKSQKILKCPTATPTEMALIDVIQLLDQSGVVLWDIILDSSEYILFKLEKGATPCFDIIDSISHFFANICRYRTDISRLWIFMLNAMYCLMFKAIAILKHCLDVMPEILPYANTYLEPGLVPILRCYVFLLIYYKCDDPFKRVEELRQRLKNKYYYNLQDDNETTLLFLLRQSIKNLTGQKMERDILELSFLIVAKRRGTRWCHTNLVQKILRPMIKGEIDVSATAKRFCITTIGHLMKPYNSEMTVHTEEVVNMLINMFKQESQPHEMKEDIIRGLINMRMSTLSERINACLSTWDPPSVSAELEHELEIYVSNKNNFGGRRASKGSSSPSTNRRHPLLGLGLSKGCGKEI